jgi:regulatory protein
VEATVSQLRAHGLVDDQAFAQYWVDQRQTFKPSGARRLRAELRGRGIAAAQAEAAAVSVADSADDDAYRAALKRAGQLRQLDQRAFASRMTQFLARRGFDWDTIGPVVERLWRDVSTS